jgi:hypothetical protein
MIYRLDLVDGVGKSLLRDKNRGVTIFLMQACFCGAFFLLSRGFISCFGERKNLLLDIVECLKLNVPTPPFVDNSDTLASMADLVNEHYPGDWRSTIVNTIRPTCAPCPPHAQCLPNLEMRCNQDFIYKPHPFRLNGLLPLSGECIPDTEKQRRIAIVADRALNVLRDKAARVECQDETPIGMMERDIKAELLKYKSGSLSDEEFDALFEAAIGELEKQEEVSITAPADGTGAR